MILGPRSVHCATAIFRTKLGLSLCLSHTLVSRTPVRTLALRTHSGLLPLLPPALSWGPCPALWLSWTCYIYIIVGGPVTITDITFPDVTFDIVTLVTSIVTSCVTINIHTTTQCVFLVTSCVVLVTFTVYS